MTGQSGPGIRSILLLGYMGSGKTSVGHALAMRLGWRHLDLDEEIERTEGRTSAEILRRDGEAVFRALERQVTRLHAAADEIVVSTGGGWATQPGLLEQFGPDTLSVWLRVAPGEVIRRIGSDPDRPLLPHTPDALARMLSEREPWYSRADRAVDTDRRPVRSIVDEIVRALRLPSEDVSLE